MRPALLALLASCAFCSCTRRPAAAIAIADAGDAGEAQTASDASAVIDASAAADASAAPALAGYPELFELVDGNERIGFVAVPLGAREPRPIMVALHGGSERPNMSTVCPAWRTISEGYPFVVCPRGFGGNERALGWRSKHDTEQRIARAVAATKRTFAAWVKETDTLVLAGFSMGASQVAQVAGEHPARYRRVAIGDSAHDPGPALRFSTAWVEGSGERAVFLCTTSGCEPSQRAAAKNVATRKGHARLVVAPTQVHGLSPAAAQAMRRDWWWLVAGADGWDGYAAPAEASSLPGRTEIFDP